MEQQQQTKGIGKESQLSKIAAAVNPGSMAEANPTATQSMISTFMQTFESSALELRDETNDDQKELIKTMIDEITKLQTKNMKEFEKAIGKIVGITKDLQNSDNPLLQKLGKDMEEKSREEVVKASGYTLTGEKDTFLNRLGRSVGMNTEEEPVEKNRQGIGKLVKGFASNLGRDVKRGFNIAVGREAPEGSFADNVFTSDEQKRERLLSRVDAESNETKTVSTNDTIKKVIEEYFKEDKQKSKSESSEKNSKETLTVSSLTEAFKTALDQHFSESKPSSTSSDKNTIESSSDSSNSSEKNNIESPSDSSMTKSLEEFSQESRKESNSSSEENSLISTLTDEQKNLYSQFEKLMEEFNKEEKSTEELENIVKEINVLNEKFVAAYPSTKSPSVNSEAQEDAAGISKDATIEALQKTADSNVLIQEYSNTTQEKTTETVDVLKEILELMKKMSADNQSGGAGGDGGDGGGIDIDLPDRRRGPRRSRGRLRARARMASRGIRGRVGGLARGLVSGARTVGSAILSGGARTIGMLGLGTAGATGAAGLATAGTAGLAATGATGAAGAAGAAGLGTAGAAGLGAAGATGAASLGATGATGAAGTAAGTAAAATKSTGFLGKIASGASSLGSKAGSVLSKASPGLVKGLGFAGRVAGKLALPLAAGMAAYDGYKGFNADPNATTGQKFKNAGRNVLSGLTFGLVDSTEDKMAAGEYTGTQKGAVEKPSGGGFFSRNKGMVAGPAGRESAAAAYDKMSGNKSSNIQPKAKESTGNFFSSNKGAIAGAALGPVGMLAGAAYDKMSSSKAETGKNMDGALIEQGTEATKEKLQINVPPPTVINQGGGGGQASPQLTFPGGVGNVRSNDPTWLMFQKRRAVA